MLKFMALTKFFILFLSCLFSTAALLPAGENVFLSSSYIVTKDNISLRYRTWHTLVEKKKGSVILLSGRSEFLEKYAEIISELNQRGFDVFSFDWRGQGLSTRLLPDRHKGFVKTYQNYIDDLDLFIEKVVQSDVAFPLIILAHSMGGHIALRFLHDNPGVIDRAVLVSPMIDIMISPHLKWLAKPITWLAVHIGLGNAYVIGAGDYNILDEKFEDNKLTTDRTRFMDEKNAIKKNPDLALGGVTYRWVAASFKSIDILSKKGYAEKIRTPVFIIGAGSDRIVSVESQKKISRAMPDCKFLKIAGARHEILKETDHIRSIFWEEFDRFTSVTSKNSTACRLSR